MIDLQSRIIPVEAQAILESCSRNINPSNSVIVHLHHKDGFKIDYWVYNQGGSLSDRNKVIIDYVNYLVGNYSKEYNFLKEGLTESFVFQGDDRPIDASSVAWQSKASYKEICLAPDFYYVRDRGSRSFITSIGPTWSEKRGHAVWRGSTTGGIGITLGNLADLPRYKLCKAAKLLQSIMDFGFVQVVQARSSGDAIEIETHLKAEGLMRDYLELRDFSQYKFFIQIDGNGNSWDLIKKLSLGSCMLMVDSDWVLWSNRGVRPWVHYVPVKKDLSNLVEAVQWCIANDAGAAEIASNARDFALSIDYDNEMIAAVDAIYKHSSNKTL